MYYIFFYKKATKEGVPYKKTRNKIIALGMVLILALQHSHGATAATVSTLISDFSTTQIKL